MPRGIPADSRPVALGHDRAARTAPIAFCRGGSSIDQSRRHSIQYPTLEKVSDVAVVNRTEELTNVRINDPSPSHGHRLLPETRQRLVRRSPGPKALRPVVEALFVDCFQHHDDRPLEYLILAEAEREARRGSVVGPFLCDRTHDAGRNRRTPRCAAPGEPGELPGSMTRS
jgi:hypothetical protein